MNNEKLRVLFESVEVLTEQLKSAVHQAKRIKVENDKNENVTKTIAEFNAVQSNTNKVLNESEKAIKRVEKVANTAHYTSVFLVFIAAILLGLILGYVTVKKQTDMVFDYEMKTLIKKQEEFKKQQVIYMTLQEQGVKFYNNAVLLPKYYADKIEQRDDGKILITRFEG